MNTSLLCLMAMVAAGPTANPHTPAFTVYRPVQDFQAAVALDDMPPIVIRGQSSTFLGAGTNAPSTYAPADGSLATPLPGTTYTDAGTLGAADPFATTLPPLGTNLPPAYQTYQQPFGGGITGDPWIGGGLPAPNANPYGVGAPGLYTFGFNGAQPYRYGWSGRYDVGMIANEGTTGLGGWGILEIDVEKELVTPIWNNYVFAIAPQFSYRSWEGPSFGAGLPGLHGSMYRLGLGLKLATPDYGGWNAEVGFNPGYATDFDNTDFSDAMQWDGHAVLFWRASPAWMWAFGAAFWDRVDDIVIPQAGAVWTPNDLWEFRLIFPKSRISMYMGTPFSVPTWAYVRGEYHVESYGVKVEPIPTGAKLKIQVEDWRLLAGVRTESGAIATFAELGWVFERDFKFDVSGAKGQLRSGLIGRVGVRY